MTNPCLTYQIDDIKINGVMINIEEGSGVLTDPTGWKNEMVNAALGNHGVKRKRVAPTLKFKEIPNGDDYDVKKHSALDAVEISFRDTKKNKRGRVSLATFLEHGEIGSGDSPEVTYGVISDVQWL